MGCLFSRAEPVPPAMQKWCGIWFGSSTDSDGNVNTIQLRLREDGGGSFIDETRGPNKKIVNATNLAKFKNYREDGQGFEVASCCGTYEITVSSAHASTGEPCLVVKGIALSPSSMIMAPVRSNIGHVGHHHHGDFSTRPTY